MNHSSQLISKANAKHVVIGSPQAPKVDSRAGPMLFPSLRLMSIWPRLLVRVLAGKAKSLVQRTSKTMLFCCFFLYPRDKAESAPPHLPYSIPSPYYVSPRLPSRSCERWLGIGIDFVVLSDSACISATQLEDSHPSGPSQVVSTDLLYDFGVTVLRQPST